MKFDPRELTLMNRICVATQSLHAKEPAKKKRMLSATLNLFAQHSQNGKCVNNQTNPNEKGFSRLEQLHYEAKIVNCFAESYRFHQSDEKVFEKSFQINLCK